VVAIADPARARPDVAVDVAADAVGDARLAVELHRGELAPVRELLPVDDVPHLDVLRRALVVGRAGVGDVELLVIGREAEAVRLEDLVGDLLDRVAVTNVDPIDRLLEMERTLAPL